MQRTIERNTEHPVRRVAKVLFRLPRMLLMAMVRGYQLVISPWLPSSCRYYPSCSNYAIRALQEYGALKGLTLSVWRILRCNPFAKGGYDPPRWFREPAPPPPDDDFYHE